MELGYIYCNEIPVNKNELNTLKIDIKCNYELKAPIQTEQKIGIVQVKIKEEVVFETSIIVSQKIEKRNVMDYLNLFIKNYNFYLQSSMKYLKQ